MRLVLLFFLLLLYGISHSAVRTSIATGDWTTTTTWDCACVPATTDDVVIANGHTVTLTANGTTIRNLTINSGGTLNDGIKTMFVTGNFILNGTYDGSKDITLTGTETNIDGTGIKTKTGFGSIGNLVISAGNKTILSTANLSITKGTIQINAGLTVTNYGIVTIDNDLVGGDANSTWLNEINSTLNAKTAVMATGILNASTSGNTVNYNGSVAQTIKIPGASAYFNLKAEGSDIKTLAGNITVSGNLTIASTLDVNAASNFWITLTGNWTNTGTFNEQLGRVTLNGSANQTITNTNGETFYSLRTNSAGGQIILANNVSATDTLTMSQGIVNAGSNTFTLGSFSGSKEGILNYTAGQVIGRFQRGYINRTGVDFDLPTGTAGNYRPVRIRFIALAAGSLTGEFVATNPGTSGLPISECACADSIRGTFNEGFWRLTAENSLASTNYNLDLTGNGFTSFTINDSNKIIKRSASENPWTFNGTHVARAGNTLKRAGLSGLSEFAFGDTANCLAPSTSAITGKDSVCTSVTNEPYSVINTVGSTYDWTVTGGTIASGQGLNAINVNWQATGTTGNVQVVETNGCTSGSPVNKTVTVHTIAPSSITGSTSVVENTTGEPYSVAGRTGYTYTWTITGGTQASGGTTASITVDWGVQGNGNVSVVASTGCGNAATVDLPVTITGTKTSIATGMWDATTTWDCSCVPSSGDNALIVTGHVVTLPGGPSRTIANFTINSGGELADGAKNLTVTGNFTINGTYSGSGVLTLSGSGTNIGGTGSITNTTGMTISGNKTITSTATLTKSTGAVTINAGNTVTNTGTITIGGDITGGSATSTWVNSDNSTLNIGGALLTTGILNGSATGNTINYNGGAAQNVKATLNNDYWHLTATGASTKTLTDSLHINGNLTINSGSTYDVSAYHIAISGNFTNSSGTFNEVSNRVTFNGSGAQSITNTSGETFYGFIVNKSSGTLTLNDNVTVANTLTLTAGNVDATTDTLVLGSVSADGTLNYSGGTVVGVFRRFLSTTGAKLFPIGTASYYRPASMNINTAPTAGSVIAKFVSSDPGTSGYPLTDAPSSDKVTQSFTEGYWELISANGFASSDYNLDLTGNGFSSFTITGGTRLVKRASAGVPWTFNGSHGTNSGNTVKRTGLSGLSQFAFGDTSACATPPAPTITGRDSVCKSEADIYYSVAYTAGRTYAWTVTGGSITLTTANGDSIRVTYGTTGGSGAGNVSVTESSNCGTGPAAGKPINIHPYPTSAITGRDAVGENSPDVQYSVVSNSGYSYTWVITGGTQDQGGTTNSITIDWGAPPAGTVKVVGKVSGCGNADTVSKNVIIYPIIYSDTIGAWSDANTWECNCVPLITDNVKIQSGDSVYLTAATTANNLEVMTGGVLDNSTFVLTLDGEYDYIINGVHSGTGKTVLSGTVTFWGGTGTISNSGNLEIIGGSKETIAGTDLTKTAGDLILEDTVTVTNLYTLTIAGNIIGNGPNATFTNGVNGTLNAGGSLLTTGKLNASASGNTINYNGSGSQTIKIPETSQYQHLNVSTGGTKTLAGNIDVNGNLTINTATLDVSLSNYLINLAGNWSNTGGAFTEGSGKVVLDGTGTQSITNAAGETFKHLELNNSAGLTLNNNVTVDDSLIMKAGNITTGANTLTLGTGTTDPGALNRTSGTITGNFQRWIDATGAWLFPVGTSTNYRPANLTINTLTTPGTLTGSFSTTAPGQTGMPVTDGAFNVDSTFTEGFWSLTAANGLASSNHDLNLTGTGFTSKTYISNTRLLRRIPGANPWTVNGTHVAADVSNKIVKRSGMSVFGDFAVGDTGACAGPTPVFTVARDSVCTGELAVAYSAEAHAGNTYTWTIIGGTIATGQGTKDITVNWGSTAREDAIVRVVETDACRSSDPKDTTVVIHTLATSSITGVTSAEVNAVEIYSVTARTGYTYTWSLPQAKGLITAGQGSSSVTITWGAVAGNDTVVVVASTGCGSAASVRLPVLVYASITSLVTGPWDNTGTWSCACIPSASQSVTIQAGHSVTTASPYTSITNIVLSGILTNNITFAITGNLTIKNTGDIQGTGAINYTGSLIKGDNSNCVITTSGLIRMQSDATIDTSVLLRRSTGNIEIAGGKNVTNKGNINIQSTLNGASSGAKWTNDANSKLTIHNNMFATFGTLTATATGNTVEFKTNVTTIPVVTYYNVISDTTVAMTFGGGQTINNDLTLESGSTTNLTGDIIAKGNWVNNGGTFNPGAYKVTFNGTGTQTITMSGASETFNHLTIAAGSTVQTAGATDTIKIKGDFVNEGAYTRQNNTVAFKGSAIQYLYSSGNTSFHDLEISNGAGVQISTGTYDVYSALKPINGAFATNNSLRFMSDASSTARIDSLRSGASISGNITAQRHATGSTNHYKLISVPVGTTTIADWNNEIYTQGFTGADNTLGTSNIIWYDETVLGTNGNGYVYATNVTNSLAVGAGYFVRLLASAFPIVLDAVGPPNTGDITMPVSFTDSPEDNSHDGWCLIGNPYQSTIDWDAAGWTRSGLTNSTYTRKENGTYATYPAGGPGANGGSRYIPPAQAFWVQASSAPSLILKESCKVSNNQAFLKTGASSYPYIKLIVIDDATKTYSDEAVIRFVDGSSIGIDTSDSPKLENSPPNPNVSTVVDSTDMVINSIPILAEGISYEVRMKSPATKTYRIYGDGLTTLPQSKCVLLEDMFLGATINLRTDTYTISIPDTSSTPRFKVHIYPGVIASASLSCAGDSVGLAVVKAQASALFDYRWINTANSDTIKKYNVTGLDTIQGLGAGTYNLQLVNQTGGCGTVSDLITISEPDPMILTSNHTDISCFGYNNGRAVAALTGGTGAYSYLWNDPMSQPADTAVELIPGTYKVTASDANGCSKSDSVLITEPLEISIISNVTDVSCAGLGDGGISLFVSNGILPLKYSWSNGDTIKNIAGLSANTYNLTITDATGCIRSDVITITEPVPVASNFTISSDTAYITVSGGSATVQFTNKSTGAYTYTWDFGDGSATSTDIEPSHSYSAAGTYTVTLTAKNNSCENIAYKTIVIVQTVGVSEVSMLFGTINFFADKNDIFIRFNLRDPEEVHIAIYNMLGQPVMKTDVKGHRETHKLKIGDKSKGVYFIRFETADEVRTSKIILGGK